MGIKQKDIEILNLLREGKDINSIAEKLKIPKSTVYYHVEKLKKNGVITGFKVSLNYADTKNYKSALILVSLTKTNTKSTASFLDSIKQNKLISDIYSVTGDWDLVLVVNGTKEDVAGMLMKELNTNKNINRTHSLFIVEHLEL
ncbi:Lrp/AsnC family transcriptional regulator [Candidatus Parvarchaeota archaeon]|nr:Lrp/AsnC family transcriptional regulator [Candidatus Parvarchaeota archaeon]